MAGKDYQLLEHTADIGIKVEAGTLKGLFKKAAWAMFDIMAGPLKKSLKIERFLVKQEADNLEDLFIRWLNELLSLSAAREKIFFEFKFKKLDSRSLEAEIGGRDMANYKVNTEIKAATYHDLEIKRVGPGWQAKVIFDV